MSWKKIGKRTLEEMYARYREGGRTISITEETFERQFEDDPPVQWREFHLEFDLWGGAGIKFTLPLVNPTCVRWLIEALTRVEKVMTTKPAGVRTDDNGHAFSGHPLNETTGDCDAVDIHVRDGIDLGVPDPRGADFNPSYPRYENVWEGYFAAPGSDPSWGPTRGRLKSMIWKWYRTQREALRQQGKDPSCAELRQRMEDMEARMHALLNQAPGTYDRESPLNAILGQVPAGRNPFDHDEQVFAYLLGETTTPPWPVIEA